MGSDHVALIVAFAVIVGFVVLVFRRVRPHTVIKLTDRRARLVRGGLPPGLLSDLSDVARSTGADGTVRLKGEMEGLRVSTSGLHEFVDQRVRNVIHLRRLQIRRP